MIGFLKSLIRKASPVRYAGERVSIAGKTYVLPALPLGAAYLLDGIKDGVLSSNASSQTFIQIVYLSLLRNYPELDIEKVAQGLDLPGFMQAYQAFLRVNKLEAAEPGKQTAASR